MRKKRFSLHYQSNLPRRVTKSDLDDTLPTVSITLLSHAEDRDGNIYISGDYEELYDLEMEIECLKNDLDDVLSAAKKRFAVEAQKRDIAYSDLARKKNKKR